MSRGWDQQRFDMPLTEVYHSPAFGLATATCPSGLVLLTGEVMQP